MDSHLTTHPMISMREDATIREAAALMADYQIGAIGVLDGSKAFRGIFTERDLVALVARGRDLESVLLRDVANDYPVVVEGPVSKSEAAALMRQARIRHLVVGHRGDYRIVSIRDLNVPQERPSETPAEGARLGET